MTRHDEAHLRYTLLLRLAESDNCSIRTAATRGPIEAPQEAPLSSPQHDRQGKGWCWRREGRGGDRGGVVLQRMLPWLACLTRMGGREPAVRRAGETQGMRGRMAAVGYFSAVGLYLFD